jgi:hypothetical protein
MTDSGTSVELTKWLKDMITYFRNELGKLSLEERKLIPNTSDYTPPCQVEVIWLKQPENQLVIVSHFEDRPDLEIIVDGPYSSSEFVRNAEMIIKEARWDIPTAAPSIYGTNLYSEGLALVLNQFMSNIQRSLFLSPIKSGPSFGMLLGKEIWIQSYVGSILEMDYIAMVNKVIDDIKRKSQTALKSEATKVPIVEEPLSTGFFTFFYLPVVIGSLPKPTISDRLRGMRYEFSLMEKAFDCSFRGKDMVINKNGQIFVLTTSSAEALRILNTIMSVATLRGFECYAIRENELGNGQYDKQTKSLKQSTMTFSSMRMMQGNLFTEPFFFGRREIQESKLREFISEAERYYANQKLVEELRLFIESFTHLKDSEYGQSFILAWTIIERFLYELWEKKLHEMDIDENRHSKLLNTAQWTVDYVLEVLSMVSDISDIQYEEFSELKTKRNKYTHKGKVISKEDAERCLNRAREIVLTKLKS